MKCKKLSGNPESFVFSLKATLMEVSVTLFTDVYVIVN